MDLRTDPGRQMLDFFPLLVAAVIVLSSISNRCSQRVTSGWTLTPHPQQRWFVDMRVADKGILYIKAAINTCIDNQPVLIIV